MALPKVCGIETEYGIMVRGGDPNPVAASSLLINAYVAELTGRDRARREGARWDYIDEHPANDARGFSLADGPPELETNLVNAVLTNGARYYVDHAHPELSNPEVVTAYDAVRYDRAAEEIVVASMAAANRQLATGGSKLGRGAEVVIYKDNSDGKGNTYGCHENYLLARATPFGRLAAQVTPHLVTRQVFSGAGKIGCELPGVDPASVPYQLSQRADFFEEEIGLETTLKRPIVNTRDEPHADSQKYRRLHVIIGDANLSEVATFLKLGTTQLVLAMIEDDVLGDDWLLAHPVPAVRQVSHDPTLRATIALADGRRATALEVQWGLYELAVKYRDNNGLDAVGGETVGGDILRRWEQTLAALEAAPESLAGTVDWIAKRRLLDAYAGRHGLAVGDARLRALALQYHDLRPSHSLARRAGLERLIDDDAVTAATTEPPTSTRAYFRGRCLAKYPDAVVAANWDSMVFDTGSEPLSRVPMLEPLRGTAEHVASLIDQSDTAAELLRRLGA